MLWLQEHKCYGCRNINVMVAGTEMIWLQEHNCFGCNRIHVKVAGT